MGNSFRISEKNKHIKRPKNKVKIYNMEIEKESDDSSEYLDTIEELGFEKKN